MAREPAQSFQQALEVLNSQEITERLSAAKDQADVEVRKNPWLFIGLAAALSLIIGFLVGRRSK